MAFEGISAVAEPTRALARVARRTTDADRGILNRGLPTARVRAVGFDPDSRAVVLQLDTGEQLRVAARYDGKPNPGVYTLRRAVRDVHDGTAFVPDRPMGGTANREGYVIAFDSPLRATLVGVQQFTVSIGGTPSPSVVRRAVAVRQVADVPSAPGVGAAGGFAADGGPTTDAATIPDAGAPPSAAGVDGRGTDNRLTDDKATVNRGTGITADADTVTFSITWWGHFGADLSATVRIYGLRLKGKPIELAETTIEDPDKQGGKANERLGPAVLEVPRYHRYRIAITPLNKKPDDRYKPTTIDRDVGKKQQAVNVDQELAYQRKNTLDVDDTWDWRKIDRKKAADAVDVDLLGRRITLHRSVVPLVTATNVLFLAQPEAVRRAILDSIFKMWGRERRTTTTGWFSNHSIGTAFDINENQPTKQNHHFKPSELPLLVEVVQPVVRLDPKHATFNVMRANGIDQLSASTAFNERFPAYLAMLLNRHQDAADLDRLAKAIARRPGDRGLVASRNALFATLQAPEHRRAIRRLAAQEKDGSPARKHLELIASNWNYLFTWVVGAAVRDDKAKEMKRLVGFIPLHPKLLEILLKAGWKWGGDWTDQKDYMHFEDPNALKHLKRSGT